MLRAAIICPDQDLASSLEKALLETRVVGVILNLNRYPDAVELEKLIAERGVEAVFLSFESPHQFTGVASVLGTKAAGVPISAVGIPSDHAALLEMMRVGVRELLSPPFPQDKLREALVRITKLVDRKGHTFDRLYSFLPAKPGSGASTVALNTAVALSRLPDTAVLLIDFDLNTGILGFMLKLNSRYSVIDAIENSQRLDQDIWAKLVWPVDKLDLLPTGALNPGLRIEPAQIRGLLAFARRHYRAICVDHSGMMEKYSLELLRESGRIFLVCTPEVPSLHLGSEKLKYLRGLDLAGRVEILLNRSQQRSVLSREQIEAMLGAAVRVAIPNDYLAVHQAMMSGQPLPSDSRLGKHFDDLARNLMEIPAIGVTRKRRFFEYLSLGSPEPATPGNSDK